jgi:hypothetical protein
LLFSAESGLKSQQAKEKADKEKPAGGAEKGHKDLPGAAR